MDYNKNQNKNQSTDNKPKVKSSVENASIKPERVIKHSLDSKIVTGIGPKNKKEKESK